MVKANASTVKNEVSLFNETVAKSANPAEIVNKNLTIVKRKGFVLLILLLSFPFLSFDHEEIRWGFYAHRKINRLAVFTLPTEMIGFYKKNLQYIIEQSVNPDMRRYVNKMEAPRHYIDLDVYGDSALDIMPKYWKQAVEKFTADTLQAYGIVPWHIDRVRYRLTEAFKEKDLELVLRYSADLGHYVGDANVPLHTTENYNGQLTNQYGIHGFWESRLPELFSAAYDFFVGKAAYLENPQLEAWKAVKLANNALDSVLRFEKQLTVKMGEDKKYAFETRGAGTVRVYSYDFSEAYHDRLSGMVERRMRAAVKMVGDFWYTCWVDAGQPILETDIIEETEKEKIEVNPKIKVRNHESGSD